MSLLTKIPQIQTNQDFLLMEGQIEILISHFLLTVLLHLTEMLQSPIYFILIIKYMTFFISSDLPSLQEIFNRIISAKVEMEMIMY